MNTTYDQVCVCPESGCGCEFAGENPYNASRKEFVFKIKLCIYFLTMAWLFLLTIHSEWIAGCSHYSECIKEVSMIYAFLVMPVAMVAVVSYIFKVDLPILSLLTCATVPVFFTYYSISGDANAPLIIAVTPFYVLFFAVFSFLVDLLLNKLLFKGKGHRR